MTWTVFRMPKPTHRISRQFSQLIPVGTTGMIRPSGDPESEGEALEVEEQYPYLFFPGPENDLAVETRAAISRGVLVKANEVEEIE